MAGCLRAAEVEGRQDWTENERQQKDKMTGKVQPLTASMFKTGEKKTKRREEQSRWKRQQAKLNKKKTQTNGKQGTFQGSYILLMCPAIKRTSSSRVSWIWFIPIAMWTTISRETDKMAVLITSAVRLEANVLMVDSSEEMSSVDLL